MLARMAKAIAGNYAIQYLFVHAQPNQITLLPAHRCHALPAAAMHIDQPGGLLP